MSTEVKGSAVLSRLQYIEENGGQPVLERVFGRLSAPVQTNLEGGLFPDVWYPLEFYVDLNRAICDELADGDPEFLRELGRHSAQQALSTIFGAFYEKGNPQDIFEKAPWVWAQYFSTGHLAVTNLTERRFRFHIRDFDFPCPEVCLTVLGWMEKNVELSGGLDIQGRELSCRATGADTCELEVSWS